MPLPTILRKIIVLSFSVLCLTGIGDDDDDVVRPNANDLVPATFASEAVLVHGTQRTPIRIDGDMGKVKDGDTVLLGEGRYFYPNFNARGVKLVGKGWDKTWLTEGIPAAKLTLSTRETQFWNMTIPHPEILNDGMSWFVNVRFFYEPNSVHSRTVPGNPSTALLSYMTVGGRILVDPVLNFNQLGSFHLTSEREKATIPLVLDRDVALPELKKFGEQAAKAVRGGKGKVDPDLARDFFESKPKFEAEIQNAGVKSNVPKRMLEVLSQYFAFETGIAPPSDPAKAEPFLAKAKAAKAEGALFVAQVFLNEARAAAGGVSPEADALGSDISTSLGDEFGCVFQYGFVSEGIAWTRLKDSPLFSATNYETELRRLMSESMSAYVAKNYPLLTLKGPNSRCTIALRTKRDFYKVSENVTKVEVKSAWVESAAAQERREMYAQAAARAAQKASAARWNAATEAMAGTAKKMYEGRVRTENYGGQSYLVYGTGNFAGSASAATTSELERAKEAGAQARAAQNNADPDLVEVKTTLKTFFRNYEYTTAMEVEMATKGEKPRVLLGPTTTEKWSVGPCTRRDEGRLFDDCPGGTGKGTTGVFVNLAYLRTHVEPFVDHYLVTSVLPRIFKKISDASKSKSATRQLDAMIVASQVGVVYDESKLAKLTENVFGRTIPREELVQLTK